MCIAVWTATWSAFITKTVSLNERDFLSTGEGLNAREDQFWPPSVSDLPVHAPTTSTHSANSPLSPPITPSLFHSRLKTIGPT